MKNIITLTFCLLLSVSSRLVKAQTCHAGTISALKDTVCQGLPVTLKVTGSSGNIQWQLATIDTFANINGAIDSIYKSVPLIQTTYFRVVVSNGSCSDTSSELMIFVPTPLISSFTSSFTLDTVIFNSDSSKGNIAKYRWDFGDGSTSNAANPLHIYAKDTTYYVCLTVYDSFNCSYTFCRYVDIVVGNPYACYPAFTFSYSGNTVHFTASVPGQRSYTWVFGDGEVDEYANTSVYHTYDSTKAYMACLSIEVWPDYFCESCDSISIVINAVKPVLTNNQPLLVYPNPCTDCEIKGLQNPDELLVTDLLGRAIPVSFVKESNSYRLSFSSNGVGVYLIKNGRTGEVVKFVKE